MFRAAKESNGGTVSNAWHFVAEDMEATADTHKSIASLLVEEIVKPLKMFAEAQHRTRKSVESLLEKGRGSMKRFLILECFLFEAQGGPSGRTQPFVDIAIRVAI